MSLSELTDALPERLPDGLSYNSLGEKFLGVLSRKSIHIQPSSANHFSPEGQRVIRLNIVANEYMIPGSFRLQFKFKVTADAYAPLGPASLLFDRVRVISNGVTISDENYFDRMQTLLHQWMDREQYKEICNESFNVLTDEVSDEGVPTFTYVPVPVNTGIRVTVPFISTPIFCQKKLIPLRFMPLTLEILLKDTYTSAAEGTTAKWALEDCVGLCDVVQLDPGLEALINERHRTDRIPLKMREWSTSRHQMANPASATEFVLNTLKGVSQLCKICVTFVGPDSVEEAVTLWFPPR